MISFIKQHYLPILFAVIVGVLSGLPQHLSQIALGPDYQGIPYLFQDAEAVYLTRIQEFKDGHSDVSSPFLHEYKDGKSVMPPTGEHVYWAITQVTQLPIVTVVVVSKYIFPAILFLLVYALVLLLIREGEGRRLLALSAGVLVTLGYELVDISTTTSIFNSSYASTYLSIWSRMVNPVTGAIFLFGFFISLIYVLRGKYVAVIPAVLLLSIMPGYIFSFGIASSSLVLFILAALFFRQRKTALAFASVLFGVLVLNLPHLWSILPQVFNSTSGDEALKSGLLLTRAPLFSLVLIVSIFIVSLGLVRDYLKKHSISVDSPQLFLFVVLLGSFLAMNQQVVTGKTVWPHHFVQYTIPLSMIAGLIVFYIYIRPIINHWWRIVPSSIIIISIVFTLTSIPTYTNRLGEFRGVNAYAPVFSWLEGREGPCVVLPVGEIERINSYITALTHCDVYFTHYTFIGIPRERIIHNELVNMAFQDIATRQAPQYLRDHEDRVRAVLFRDWRDLFSHSSDGWLSSISDRDEIDSWTEAQIQEISNEYKSFKQKDFRNELLKYRLDYILLDKEGAVPFDIKNFQFLKTAYEDERFTIYEIK